MESKVSELKKRYNEKKLVPFIGAGLSRPFGIPDWSQTIKDILNNHLSDNNSFLKEVVDVTLERYDFWKALDDIKYYGELSTEEIQKEIKDIIIEKYENIDFGKVNDDEHNYKDIANLNFSLILTTNYENLLSRYCESAIAPLNLVDYKSSTHNLFEDKARVMHLHGQLNNPASIVMLKENYKNLYENKHYDNLLQAITSNYSILFIGFSFKDQFVRELIKDHKKRFNGTHYILLENITTEEKKFLLDEYNLKVIEYKCIDGSHAKGIKHILDMLSDKDESTLATVEKEEKFLGATIEDINRDVSENLFYKKMLIEEIDPDLIELSSLFFIASEEFIRDLEKNAFSKNAIGKILFDVLATYKSNLLFVYKKNGNSEEFLNEVHKCLENYESDRIISHGICIEDNEKKGLIHSLANDSNQGIWWGGKRIEE